MEIEMIPVAMDDDIEADAQGFPDLGQAMSMGRTLEMEQCIAAIFQTPTEVMSPEQRFNQLWLSGGLYGAFKHGQADTAASFTRLVAAAPSDVLEPQLQFKLLLWPVSTQAASDVPLLHSVAAARQAHVQPELCVRQQRSIFAYVHEIAASELPIALKTKLCAAMGGNPGTTAAQAALGNQNPGTAAAMMCGILSASLDPLLTQILLQSLGVSIQHVLAAMDNAANRDDMQWAALLLAFLDEAAARAP